MKATFDTLIIFVQDMERLKPFYLEALGFAIVEDQTPDWLLLQAGDAKIGLHRIGQSFREGNSSEVPAYHNTKMVFEIVDDIHTFRQGLIDDGIHMKEVKTFDHYEYWICDGEDLEGNVFQLKQKKAVE